MLCEACGWGAVEGTASAASMGSCLATGTWPHISVLTSVVRATPIVPSALADKVWVHKVWLRMHSHALLEAASWHCQQWAHRLWCWPVAGAFPSSDELLDLTVGPCTTTRWSDSNTSGGLCLIALPRSCYHLNYPILSYPMPRGH